MKFEQEVSGQLAEFLETAAGSATFADGVGHRNGDGQDQSRGDSDGPAMPRDEFVQAVTGRGGTRLDGEAIQVAAEVVGHIGGAVVTAGGILLESFENDGVEIAGQRSSIGALRNETRTRHRTLADDVDHFGGEVCLHTIRRLSGEQLKQEKAKGVDVAGGGERIALYLFGAGGLGRERLHRQNGLLGGAFRGEQLGNAEVEQLGHAAGIHQNVAALEVAVEDEVAMRVIHSVADRKEEVDAVLERQRAASAIIEDGLALEVLHDEVGAAVKEAAIEQPRDVGMLEAREDLALGVEAAQHCIGIHAALDDLDGGALLELAVGAFGQVDGAHAAAAELTHHAPRAEHLGSTVEIEEVGIGLVAAQQGEDFPPEFLIAGAGFVDEALAPVAGDVERIGQNLFDPAPAFRRHCSSFCSQRRATLHSRLTVVAERPRTSAASSTVRPPKTRSSTICDWRGSISASRSMAALRVRISTVASR